MFIAWDDIWCAARFGTICAILKKVKKNHGWVLLLEELQAKTRELFIGEVSVGDQFLGNFLLRNCPVGELLNEF